MEIEHQPERMKMSIQALYDTTNEIAYEIQKDKGWNDSVLPIWGKWYWLLNLIP